MGRLPSACRRVSCRVSLRWQDPTQDANGRKPTTGSENAKSLALWGLRRNARVYSGFLNLVERLPASQPHNLALCFQQLTTQGEFHYRTLMPS